MTFLCNDPARFAAEAVDGFVAAHPGRVRRLHGGIVRTTPTRSGQVALVIGGGAGHYPAFAGLVGPGLAHGAVTGNVFASPSAAQAVSVAKAAQNGGGVLFCYGNYAGDVLNFDGAQAQLRSQNIPCQSLQVTDDIASAPAAERGRRRGIAGDLVVFKCAGAAAMQGRTLDEVAAMAALANDRTRTLGVAFSGCSLPGAEAPLFTVPPGRMAVGLGIHGEPGLDETELPTADGLAELLVRRVLAELPDGVPAADGQRVVVVLNSLGSVTHEELFVVYRRVHELLHEAGVRIADCEVGRVCTSFEMAGTSLTLLWLTDELEELWFAPADTAAFRRGETGTSSAADTGTSRHVGAAVAADPVSPAKTPGLAIPAATMESRRAARVVGEMLDAIAQTLAEHAEELGRIDAIAGDGDHGIGMQRGARAAAAAARDATARGSGLGSALAVAGDAWADGAGGTSGALWGLAIRQIGTSLGDGQGLSAAAVAAAVHSAREAVTRAGGARVGDKTMVDALVPFDDTLTEAVAAGAPLAVAWQSAALAATTAADATRSMLPRKGRARPHAAKSLGSPDPGAVSLGLVVSTVVSGTRRPASSNNEPVE